MKLTPYLLAILAIVSFASCSKKSNVPVPADAAMVFHISGSSLHSKLSWEEFKQGDLYKVAAEQAAEDALAKKILDNPDSSGIDMKSDAFLFITPRGQRGYMGFTCGLKDEKTFSSFVKQANSRAEITRDGDVSIIRDGSNVLTWNSKRFVAISNANLNSASAFGKRSYDSGFPEDSLVKFAKAIYTLKGSNSIGSNKVFTAMMKEDGDAHMWLSAGKLYGGSFGPMLSLTKASVLMEDNITAATFNFDNGKVTIDAKNHYNKELAELYKKHSSKNLDADMLKKIPAGNVAAAMAVNVPPQVIKDLLVLIGVDGLANNYLASSGLTIDDFVKANKGDFMFAVSDFGIYEKQVKIPMGDGDYSYTTKKPDAKLLFATSVNDKASFQKLLTVLQEKINEGGEKAKEVMSNIPYTLTDKWFIAGSDSAMVFGYGTANTDHPFITKISGHPMGGYIDIQQFIRGARSLADSSSTYIVDESLKFWEDIVFYGGEWKGNVIESHAEINLKDKGTSSLKQLNSYLGKIARNVTDQQKRRQEEMMRTWHDQLEEGGDSLLLEAPKLRR